MAGSHRGGPARQLGLPARPHGVPQRSRPEDNARSAGSTSAPSTVATLTDRRSRRSTRTVRVPSRSGRPRTVICSGTVATNSSVSPRRRCRRTSTPTTMRTVSTPAATTRAQSPKGSPPASWVAERWLHLPGAHRWPDGVRRLRPGSGFLQYSPTGFDGEPSDGPGESEVREAEQRTAGRCGERDRRCA